MGFCNNSSPPRRKRTVRMRAIVRMVDMARLRGTISVCCLRCVAASGLRHGSYVTHVMTKKLRGRLLFVRENGFDGAVEEASEFEGERQAGIEFPCLDRIDGLTRDFETFGEVCLGPV